jgi:MerR family transcriptional regulator, glutamine synthetase repressor
VAVYTVSVVKRERTTPVYNIGVASRLTGLPIHTLRWIERQGLVSPFRTEGNQRLFSEDDMELIQEIRELLAQHVNVPGIRIILSDRAKDGESASSRASRKARRREKVLAPAKS